MNTACVGPSAAMMAATVVIVGAPAALAGGSVAAGPDGCAVGERARLESPEVLTGARFGKAVAIDGAIAVVGAENHGASGAFVFDGHGAAFVMRKTASGWVDEATLLDEVSPLPTGFGAAVAVGGGRVLVGAPFDRDVASGAGAVHVFAFDGSAWALKAKLVADDGQRDDLFGASVAIDGEVAVIGAPQNTLTGPGFAYVFRRVDGVWNQEAKLLAAGGGEDDAFGISVAVRGDTIAVGAWNHLNNAQSFPDGEGAAYIFRWTGDNWVETNALGPSNVPSGQRDRFGRAVALDETGSVLAVGTSALTFGPPGPIGSVYVFRDDGKDWLLDAKMIPADGTDIRDTVAISGETIIAGSWQAWTTGAACPPTDICYSGAAFVFTHTDKDGWMEQSVLVPSDIARGDAFGWSVALGGGEAIIGAWRDGDGGIDSGSAYAFTGLGDCNGNDILDACDIENGTSADANADGMPDECQCAPDLTGDGLLGFFDVAAFLNAFAAGAAPGDWTGDGVFDFFDVSAYLGDFAAGCP
jgi:FG-GAP repeat protein